MEPFPANRTLAQVVTEKPVVVIEFGTLRCCACSAVGQKFDIRYRNASKVACYSISLDAQPALAVDFGIYSAPAVLVYMQGKLTLREAGIFSTEAIFSRIDRYLQLLETEDEDADDGRELT